MPGQKDPQAKEKKCKTQMSQETFLTRDGLEILGADRT